MLRKNLYTSIRFIYILISIIVRESNCLTEITLNAITPSFAMHGNEFSQLETPIQISITDCDNCSLEIRWSNLKPMAHGYKAESFGECVEFGTVLDDFDPPTGESDKYKVGQCYGNVNGSEWMMKGTEINMDLYSIAATVFQYSAIRPYEDGRNDFITLPVEDELQYYQNAKAVYGAASIPNYAYFVAVAPGEETIYTKSIKIDHRSTNNCTIEVFSGPLPSLNNTQNLIYTIQSGDLPTGVAWRVPMMTYRLSRGDCYVALEHRTLEPDWHLKTCEPPDHKIEAPALWLIISPNFPQSSKESLSEIRCLETIENRTKISVYVDQIIGGSLEVIIEDQAGKITPIKRKFTEKSTGKTLCQIAGDQFTYNWIPDPEAETSLILARVRANRFNEKLYDCPKEQDDNDEKESKKLNKWMLIGIIAGSIGLTVLIGLLFYWFAFFKILRWYTKRQRLAASSMKIKRSNFDSVYHHESRYPKNKPISHDSWEVDLSKLHIQKRIGRGAFADVFYGMLGSELPLIRMYPALKPQFTPTENGYELAVKRPLGSSDDEKKAFLAEIATMKSVGYHRHLLSLLGASTLPSSPMILTHYCEFRDLSTQLIKKNTKKTPPELKDDPSVLVQEDFLQLSWQIADALMFLASKGIVHRDVASRNVLLTKDKEAKLADFGMSRVTRETIHWNRGGRLPVRWNSPEAIELGLFTEKSDVWSYGVLLWEIYSLGETPFENIQGKDLLLHLKDGHIMDPPEGSPEFIREMMKSCWQLKPMERPSFTVISSLIQNQMGSTEQRIIREIEFSYY